MHDVEFSIYIASPTRWAHLVKTIAMSVVPRVGDFVKFVNDEAGDYFSFRVAQVTFRETGQIEVMMELLDDVDGRGFSFEDEDELDELVESYLLEGWVCPRGIGPNKHALRKKRLRSGESG